MSSFAETIVERLHKLFAKEINDPCSHWNVRIRMQYWHNKHLTHEWELMPGAIDPWHQRCRHCQRRLSEASHPCPYSEY